MKWFQQNYDVVNEIFHVSLIVVVIVVAVVMIEMADSV